MLTSRFRIALGVALFLATMFGEQSTARAVDDATPVLPEGALVMMRLSAPQRSLVKWRKFATSLDESYGPFVTEWSGMLGEMIVNPELAGVDGSRDWWLAVYPGAGGAPEIVYAIPTKKADFMQFGLGESIHFAKIRNWGVYSADEEAGKRVLQLSAGEIKSAAATLDAKSKKLLLHGDLTVHVNLTAVKSKYRTELDLARDELDKALKEITGKLPGQQGGDSKLMAEMYGKIANGVLQGIDDSRGFTFSGLVGLRGVQFEEYLAVTPNSPTAKFLQSQPPSEMKLLEKLPVAQHGYFGLHGDANSLMKWSMEMSAMFMQGDAASRKSMQELAAQFATLRFGDYLWSLGPDESGEGLFQMATVTQVTPIKRMQELTRKMPAVMSKLETPGIKQTMSLKIEAEKYGAYSADILTLKQEAGVNADPLGAVKKISDTIYGPDGMVTRIVYTADKMVQTIGGGRTAMQNVLQRLGFGGGRIASNVLVRNVRRELDKKANLIVLIDIPSLIVDTLLVLSIDENNPLPFDTDTIAGLDVKKSYLGFSLAAESEGIRAQTHIPTAQMVNLARLGEFAMESLGPLMLGPGGIGPGGVPPRQPVPSDDPASPDGADDPDGNGAGTPGGDK
jgi:hypothetical protein